MKRHLLQSIVKNESGSTAVEFGLMATAFLTIVFGTMEAGRIFWTQNALQYAIENASRDAIVNDEMTEGDIADAAALSLQTMMISGDPLNTSVVFVADDGIEYVEIDATYQYQSWSSSSYVEALRHWGSLYAYRP